MTTISIAGTTAIIEDMRWTSPDLDVAEMLNVLTQMFTDGESSPSDPWPDFNEAQRIVREMDHARIIDKGQPPEFVPGRIY